MDRINGWITNVNKTDKTIIKVGEITIVVMPDTKNWAKVIINAPKNLKIEKINDNQLELCKKQTPTNIP